ncbi:DNA alkylation repair protein [Mucilaginibacter flavus]|uniref:DNA alkylation repair protein n=1 Tax=Mucilaginibacter flavus TaxID=931504 RepID=UPI0025B39AA6|nr:DNA alkylation repair protein [Mucilaginibacter flavus]MDN3579499.1 DNA alkylation repair protein [Mucilaginibacter flavus]
MTVTEILAKLESLSDIKVRAMNIKRSGPENQFGVKMGDIRNVAKKIKPDNELAKALWATNNVEARFVATLIMVPKDLSIPEIEDLVKTERYAYVIDWLYSYVIKEYPDKEKLRLQWLHADDVMEARLSWSLTSGRIAHNPQGIDIQAVLDRIETEMPTAPPDVQWTMNSTLANIGIYHSTYRQRALDIGERLGIYRDYPVSKGCTSPFAPIWINAIVNRQG